MSETLVTTEGQEVDTDNLDDFESEFYGRNTPENAPKTEEISEQDGDEQAQVDDDAQTDEEDEAELQEEVKDPPKKKTVQDRIDEVVRQREELRRTTAAEMAALRQEIENLKKTPAQTVPAEADQKEPAPDTLKADGSPVYPLGEFDPQYIRDLTRYTLEVERTRMLADLQRDQQAAAIQQEQTALQNTWNAKVATASTEYPDFVEKGQELLNGFTNLDPNYAGYLTSVLMSMEKGTDVLYYLSNHPDEAREIVNSGAQRATLALGRIESRFLQSEENAPKPKVTKAPPPPRAQARGSNGAFIAVAPDTDDLDLFEAEFFKPIKY